MPTTVLKVNLGSGIRKKIGKQMTNAANIRVLTSEVKKAAEKQQLKRHSQRIHRHYKNMLQAIQAFLDEPGVPAVTEGGTGYRYVKASTARGVIVRVRTGVWKPLSPKYASKRPVSRKFWQKGSNRSNYKQLKDLYRRVVSSQLSRRTPRIRKKALATKTPGRITLWYEVNLGVLPFPLGEIIGESFITGKKNQRLLSVIGPGSRSSIARIAFPERQRPVISAIAARLGLDMRAELRRP